MSDPDDPASEGSFRSPPEPRGRRAVARAALGMGAWTALSRSFGFVRVLTIAAVLGTTYLGNTFQAANSVSNVLFELLAAGALSAVLVPTFVELLDRAEQAEAEHLAGSLLGAALIVLGGVALVGVVFAPALARLLTAGVSDPVVAAQQRELTTFLLRFFVPQVLLYAAGAVATAVLHARHRFAITAAAPIGNTAIMVAMLVAFRVVVGPASPGLELDLTEKLLLAGAGTLGVAAFVAILVGAARASGFHLRPRRPHRDPALLRLLRLSVWGVFLHAAGGLLLGAALVAGNSVAGGVVAYQVAFVFFLAPYAVLAQPLHTAVLPELSRDATRGDRPAFAASVRWTLDGMAVLVVPAAVAFVAVAQPLMRVVAFGKAADGVDLLAAGLASLAIGLLPYSAFLLLARAYYALGDSRTPAVVAACSAVVGVAVMLVGAAVTDGTARVAALGAGHSMAYLVGALWLGIGLARRTGEHLVPRALLPAVAVATPTGVGAWAVMTVVGPAGRLPTLGLLVAVVAVAAAAYVGGLRVATGGRVAPGSGGPGVPGMGLRVR